jgi:hypothetical protein
MNEEEASRAAFNFQLELLKAEIETVNATIRQGDEVTKSIKEWAITVWAGAVGGALAITDLRPYVWATAAIPLLFWLVDVWNRVVQRKFIWRGLVIMDFLNDERYQQSFRAQKLIGFTLMDIANRRDSSPDFEQFVSWRRVMLFKTLSGLYVGLSMISIAAWFLIRFYNKP